MNWSAGEVRVAEAHQNSVSERHNSPWSLVPKQLLSYRRILLIATHSTKSFFSVFPRLDWIFGNLARRISLTLPGR